METIHVISVYIVIALLCAASLTLLCINIHIYITSRKECKNTEGSVGKIFCLIAALCGIVCFQISLLLTIAIMVQILLIDVHKLHPESNTFHKFYFSAFEEMVYLVPAFDQFGHLCMLAVFVKRYQICFKNSVFQNTSPHSVRFLYTCLFALSVFSIGIFVEIIRDAHDVMAIIVAEIIWEILIEIICIAVFYLFISKLYHLVQFSLSVAAPKPDAPSMKRATSRADAFKNFSDTVRTTRSKSKSKSGSGSTQKQPPAAVEPSYTIQSKLPELKPQASSQRPLTPPSVPSQDSQRRLSDSGGLMDIVDLMNKLTLLVVMAVGTSLLSIIGNIFIQLHGLQTLDEHTIDVQSVWAYLLPMVDIIVTSFTLYLQFGFSSPVYSKFCSKCDARFLEMCLNLNYWHVRRQEDKHNVDVVKQENAARKISTVELQTESGASTETTSRNTTGTSSGDKSNNDSVTVTVHEHAVETVGSSATR